MVNNVLVLEIDELGLLAKVDFYDIDHSFLESYLLYPGDVSILYNGGHSFEKRLTPSFRRIIH